MGLFTIFVQKIYKNSTFWNIIAILSTLIWLWYFFRHNVCIMYGLETLYVHSTRHCIINKQIKVSPHLWCTNDVTNCRIFTQFLATQVFRVSGKYLARISLTFPWLFSSSTFSKLISSQNQKFLKFIKILILFLLIPILKKAIPYFHWNSLTFH